MRRSNSLKTIEVKDLKNGDEFYEIDDLCAIKWTAIEDARMVDGTWRVRVVRLNGVEVDMSQRENINKTLTLVRFKPNWIRYEIDEEEDSGTERIIN